MRTSRRSSAKSRVFAEQCGFPDGLYRLPSFLSKGARDLIPELLMNDPVKRITIPELRKLAWFQVSCPPYLAIPWTEYEKNHLYALPRGSRIA